MTARLLGSRRSELLDRGRALAETQFVDQVQAWKPSTGYTVDAAGLRVYGWEAVDYDDGPPLQPLTPAKVTGRSRLSVDTTAQTVRLGGVEVPVIVGGLHIPVGAPLPHVGWEYEMVTVGDRSNSALVGQRYYVANPVAKTSQTAMRLDVAVYKPPAYRPA